MRLSFSFTALFWGIVLLSVPAAAGERVTCHRGVARMNPIRDRFVVTVSLLLVGLWATSVSPAHAQSSPRPAPDMPLPPCVFVDGQWQGACPAESDYLSGSAVGRFSAGGTVTVWTDPVDEACDTWTWRELLWSPSPCYNQVSAPRVVTCATIDLTDGERFRELSCPRALYLDTEALPNPLFSTRRPSGYEDWQGATTCGATPAFNVYFYGGPATQPDSLWRNRGPLALPCEMTFLGPRRPDGLYGPTWAKVEVGIRRIQSGDTGTFGSPVWAQFYIPINGDLRDSVDVAVEAEGSVTEADWDNGRVLATYTATVSSEGSDDAENVRLTATFPTDLSIQDVSSNDCRISNGPPGYTGGSLPPGATFRAGGNVECNWATLAAGSSTTVTITARILNATDLHALQEGLIPAEHHPGVAEAFRYEGVGFVVRADEDSVDSNNESVVAVDIPFRSGSYDQTRAEMARSLDQYFQYFGADFNQDCSHYKQQIINQLEAIHNVYPEALDNLSYGPITSGSYRILGSFGGSGHVGVVIYTKGTNFRETGIIVHGTPWPNPILNYVSEHGNGLPAGGSGLGATSMNGSYLITHANQYPGFPMAEGPERKFFEGQFIDNGSEFVAGGGTPPATGAWPMEGLTCPFAPDAVVVGTESPVELVITNSQGQQIETDRGALVAQELDATIFAASFPHEDGTFAWALSLPVDTYNVQLRGVAEGSYELRLTTFDGAGNMLEEVISGSTSPGLLEEFTVTPELIFRDRFQSP